MARPLHLIPFSACVHLPRLYYLYFYPAERGAAFSITNSLSSSLVPPCSGSLTLEQALKGKKKKDRTFLQKAISWLAIFFFYSHQYGRRYLCLNKSFSLPINPVSPESAPQSHSLYRCCCEKYRDDTKRNIMTKGVWNSPGD